MRVALLLAVAVLPCVAAFPAIAQEEPPACVNRPGLDHLVCARPLVPPAANYGVHPLDDAHRERMLGPSWRPGCPVALRDLALVVIPFVDSKGVPHAGELVIATRFAASAERVFNRLFKAAFPIESLQPMENFDGDDTRAMDANNTSGFNCRRGAAFGEWSRHSYGDAIDLNPLWNPQVKGAWVKPEKGVKFLNRANVRPGMAIAGGTAVKTFRAEGWRWGGFWPRPQDFQHFSVSGR